MMDEDALVQTAEHMQAERCHTEQPVDKLPPSSHP